ncbi:MAG: membrane protein insertion efficiency factor YidD [Verrucomicrobiales bacterium]|nr:membrane protein insertion efficiency factor YidD [Verrucomicrobiales bacterium]
METGGRAGGLVRGGPDRCDRQSQAAVRFILLTLVRVYRWLLSPLKGFLFGPTASCRHVPSCSAYAEEALRRHGAGRGSWLAARRLVRCHPWGTSGWDPVPELPVVRSQTRARWPEDVVRGAVGPSRPVRG